MKHLPTLLLSLALAGAASAANAPLSFTAALAHSSQQPAVIAARAALDTAQSDLAKAKADPLGTKVTLLKAQQAYDLALATLKTSQAQAESQIASAFTQVVEAQDGVKVASAGLKLAQTGAQVAQTQYAKGGGTQISAQVAQNAAQAAQQSLRVAQDGLSLASDNLRSLVGTYSSVSPVAAAQQNTRVTAGVVDDVLSRNPTLLQARQAVVALQLQVNLLDPLSASASQINTAKTQLQQAQSGADSAARGLKIQAQGLYNSYLQASKNLDVKRAALQNAQRQLTADQGRYAKGLISQLALMQSSLSAQQAQLASEQAEDAVLNAYYALQAGPAGAR